MTGAIKTAISSAARVLCSYHCNDGWTTSAIMSRFGLSQDEAFQARRLAEEQARRRPRKSSPKDWSKAEAWMGRIAE
jgi:hypothetical protein